MVLYGILTAALLAAAAGAALSHRRAGALAAGIEELRRRLLALEESLSGIQASLRAIAAAVDPPEDAESARQARAEIDRFNAGIASILAFGLAEKDGERK